MSEFKAEHGTFKTIFYHAAIQREEGLSIQQKIYAFCKEPKTREKIVKLTGMSRYYTIGLLLKKMIEKGRIGRFNIYFWAIW